ncbi:cell envelope integrity protein TolA [Rhizobium sp. FKY42]|uniref:cell envelope integrity protein TolA n=1 Tax=Rhizobium sp. FKY42 TaxID=2562310 RepID=UPI0010BF9AC6|nr:cell envelope integrity protein TolA [Rhizobium sp. FKY42]
MKTSLGTSLVAHTVILAWALVSISAPASFEVAPVEALPVDIVPVESITQIQQGDKKAPMTEKPSPKKTEKQNVVENAENAGENDVDLKNPPTPVKKPTVTETAAAPPKNEKPLPNPTTENNDVKEIAKEETAPKPVETAALPIPKPEITPPTPKPEPPKPEPQKPEPQAQKVEETPLPTTAPVPAARPRPEPPKQEEAKPVEKPPEKKPEQKPAEKPQDKKTDTANAEKPSDKKVADKKQETAKSASSKQSDFNADEIAAQLNKVEAAGGGAKRSQQMASLGGKKNTGGSSLSQSEMDALKGQIQNNWSVISGVDGGKGMIITVTMKLDPSGAIVGRPEVTSSGGNESARRMLEGSAIRAVMRSSPFKNLPADKYDAWSEVVVNFDPSELL